MCARCSDCRRVRAAGFTATDGLYCTVLGRHVDGDDGCTFGTVGEPSRGVYPHGADIGQYKPPLSPCGW